MKTLRIILVGIVAITFCAFSSCTCFGGNKEHHGGTSTGTGTGSGTVTNTGAWTGTYSGTAAFGGTGVVLRTNYFTRVFDPKLDGNPQADFSVNINYAGSHNLTVKILSGVTEIITLKNNESVAGQTPIDVKWNGKNGSNLFVDTGTYTVRIQATGSFGSYSEDFTFYVVRLYADFMSFTGAAAGEQYNLVFNQTTPSNLADCPFGGIDNGLIYPNWVSTYGTVTSTCDFDSGLPRPEQPPRGDPDSAVDSTTGIPGYNWPAAYKAGSRIAVYVRTNSNAVSNISHTAISAGYPAGSYPIHIEGEWRGNGFTSASESGDPSNIAASSVYLLTSQATLPATIGLDNETVNIKYSFYNGTSWIPVPGYQTTTHTIYRTGGEPIDGALAAFPALGGRMFVSVLDWSCRWCQEAGVTSKSQVVAATYPRCWNFGNPTYKYDHVMVDLAGQPDGFNAGYLVDNHVGRCGAWCNFYLCIVGYQGEYIQVYTIINDNHQFAAYQDGSYLASAQTLFQVNPSLPGQGNPSPANQFMDHGLNYYYSKIYDPSYVHTSEPAASGYTSLHQYEEAGFTGYYWAAGEKYTYGPLNAVYVVPYGMGGTFAANNPDLTEVVSWASDQ